MTKPSLLNSIKWNYLGAIMKGILQMGVLAILARLISPEEFGLMALALVAIKFGRYFSDFGLAAAIQQKQDINNVDIEASFWFSLLSGFIFTLSVGVLAKPLAVFFENPKLEPVIEIVAISFLLIGASSTSTGLLKRNMQFKFISLAETSTYLMANGVIAVVLAYLGYGVYSLAIAYLSQLFLMFLLSYAKTRHSLKPQLKLSAYKHMLRFGGGYSISGFMTFIAGNIDHMLIGKFFPTAALGAWNRGRNIVTMPNYTAMMAITGALFPTYSKHQNDLSAFSALYQKSLIIAGYLLIPVGAGMYAAATPLVAVLLGPGWSNAIPFVELAAMFVPAEMLASFVATACTALGILSTQIRIQTFLLLLVVPVMLYFSINTDLQSILFTLSTYYWIRFIVYMIVIGKQLAISWKTQFKIVFLQLLSGIWVYASVYLADNYLGFLNPFILLPIEIGIAAISLAFFIVVGPAYPIRSQINMILNKKSNSYLYRIIKFSFNKKL